MPDVAEPVRAPDPLKLLLLDTCGSEATVAVAAGRVILGQIQLPGRSASEGLIGAIGEVLRERNWRLQELDALVVVRGPGSFTGVRVGLSAMKALAEACGRPLIAVSRLEVLAKRSPARAIAVLSAGRDEVFWAELLANGVGEQAVAPLASVMEHARGVGLPIVCETGTLPGRSGIDLHEVSPLTAADALPLALDRLLLGQADDPLLLAGLYLGKTER